MKKLLLALALLLTPTVASAQCNGVFPNNTICGNITGSSNLPRPVPNSALTGVPGGTNGQIQYNNSGLFGGFTPGGDLSFSNPNFTINNNAVTNAKINAGAIGTVKGSTNGTSTTDVFITTLINAACIATPTSCASLFGYVNPIWYGAACDGVTHDETAFQAALTASITATRPLLIPVGNCILNATITNGTALFTRTVIYGYGADSAVTFIGDNGFAFNAQASYYNLQNFQIASQSAAGSPCLKIYHTSQSSALASVVSGLYLSNCGVYGMYFQNMVETSVINNTIINDNATGYGIKVDNTATADVGGNLIRGNLIININAASALYGIRYDNVGGTRTLDNSISGYGYDIYYNNSISSGAATGIQIQNNQLDNYINAGIWFGSSTATGAIVHVNISGNVLHAKGTGAIGSYGIVIEQGSQVAGWALNVAVVGNTIDTATGTAGIDIAGSTALAITGNSLIDQNGVGVTGIVTTATSADCVIVGNAISQFGTHVTNTAGCTTAGNN